MAYALATIVDSRRDKTRELQCGGLSPKICIKAVKNFKMIKEISEIVKGSSRIYGNIRKIQEHTSRRAHFQFRSA